MKTTPYPENTSKKPTGGSFSRHAFEWIANSADRRQNPHETTMTALTHMLNIGTLAAWLSVAGFGTVAVVFPEKPIPMPRMVVAETKVIPDDFQLGDATEQPSAEQPAETDPASVAETLPAPPDLPEVAETTPLPDVPEVPAAAESPAPQAIPAAKPTTHKGPSVNNRQATAGGRSTGKPGAGSSGMSTAARIAAGRMPAPIYPSEARRKGQTGTVVVQFTVDSSGRVTYANAISPSPWPLLNQEAVRTVLTWRFPPGDFISLERPIVFRLK